MRDQSSPWLGTRSGSTSDQRATGPVRAGLRTKDLVKELEPGDIALIDHGDLDVVAAESLVAARPAAVLNCAASSSGRYPNEGPLILLRAGIPLVDHLGREVFDDLAAVGTVTIIGGEVHSADSLVARGIRQTEHSIGRAHELAEKHIDAEFERFVDNTLRYIDSNRDLVDGVRELPPLKVGIAGRHVLIVVRGATYKEDLALLQRSGYLGDQHPVLIGVDGGADAILDLGLTPDLIIGDMDSVSERALGCGAELVVHAYRDGRAPGAARLHDLGLDCHLLPSSGTSEDIAMLLAYDLGAELIVAVGTHSSMVEFLDKGRAGMASTVLVRMKVGTRLVDAKGVSRLYRQAVGGRQLLWLVLAAGFVLVTTMVVSGPIRLILRTIWLNMTSLVALAPGSLW